MNHCIKLLVFFVTLTGSALAQTSADTPEATAESSASPVAIVYVSRPTHVDAFAVSSSGKLTAVPGSPFANISLSHMSVNKKFLFGASDDKKDIITYSIASNGALKKVAEIDTYTVPNAPVNCDTVGPTSIDHTGETLYNFNADCEDSMHIESFKIESNGELQYLGSDGDGDDIAFSPPALLGNNKYAYVTGSDGQTPSGFFDVFKRESDGLLQKLNGPTVNTPKPKNSDDVYSPFPIAVADSSDHAALILELENKSTGYSDAPAVLVSYTADSKGNLTTTNTYNQTPAVSTAGVMSISPSNKLLAVGGGPLENGKGFQVYHFNGGSPITKYTGVLHSSEYFLQFGWDKSNHLFALGSNALHIYSATSTSIKEESGSPISIPEASSVIVLSK